MKVNIKASQTILFCLTKKLRIAIIPATLYLLSNRKYKEHNINSKENTSVYTKKKNGNNMGKKQYCKVLIIEYSL